MEASEQSIFEKTFDPILQAGIALGLVVVFTLGAKLIQFSGMMEVGQLFPWLVAASFILCFALFNSIFSLSAPNMNSYWTRSMLSFAVLSVLSGSVAWLFSSTSIGEAGTYKWIFFVLTLGYLVFLSIVRFMKNIVNFAEREEWQRPKERKRTRKR